MSDQELAELNDVEAHKNAIYRDMLEWPIGGKYSLDTKLEVITHYFLSGSLKKVSQKTGVPETTLCYWKKHAPWWDSQLASIRAEKSASFTAKTHNIIDKAQNLLLDRLENGDDQVLRDGSIVKKGISGKDLSTIIGINYDKLRIEYNLPNKITSNDNTLLSVMSKLLQHEQNMQKQAINGDFERIDPKPEIDE